MKVYILFNGDDVIGVFASSEGAMKHATLSKDWDTEDGEWEQVPIGRWETEERLGEIWRAGLYAVVGYPVTSDESTVKSEG